jgi:quinol monooxygenase YgiN
MQQYATTMNTFNVTPERIKEVLEFLIRSAENVVRYEAGFISFNFHVSDDRTQIASIARD